MAGLMSAKEFFKWSNEDAIDHYSEANGIEQLAATAMLRQNSRPLRNLYDCCKNGKCLIDKDISMSFFASNAGFSRFYVPARRFPARWHDDTPTKKLLTACRRFYHPRSETGVPQSKCVLKSG